MYPYTQRPGIDLRETMQTAIRMNVIGFVQEVDTVYGYCIVLVTDVKRKTSKTNDWATKMCC